MERAELRWALLFLAPWILGTIAFTIAHVLVAIPLTVLTDVTTGNVADVRAVMYGVAQGFYLTWTAEDSTNRSSSTTARTDAGCRRRRCPTSSRRTSSAR